jgi:hypothetical protein
MRYRLNESHSYRPSTPANIAAVQRVTDFLSGGRVASEEELRSVLRGISNPHGDVVKWLARRSRRVLIPIHDTTAATRSSMRRAGARASTERRAPVDVSESRRRAGGLWTNPHSIDLSAPLIYRIEIWADDGSYFDYIGKARSGARLREYDRNLRKIAERRERGTTQKYRAIHYALYLATQNGWQFTCYPLENCHPGELNTREQQLISEHPCSLNNGKGWRVAEIDSVSLHDLLR